ncbi:hypothetical protein [Occultella kanbiaonis]|uniref:hypothetical protein n=1 Tax=Occultella kanbiaonis TaxID=2675754 RepID=UPI0013D3E320|nr:hypothetical protein [Occultella kanbiaonis]
MGRGAAEEFVLDFDEPDQAGEPDAAAPPRRRQDGPGLPRPVALWAGVAVLLVVTGILIAPPPPGPSWGVGPGWTDAPVLQWSVPLSAPVRGQTWLTVQDDHVLVIGEDRIDAYDRADGTHRWSVADVERCELGDGIPVCVSGPGADAVVSIVAEDGGVLEVPFPGAVTATLHRGDLVVLAEGAADDFELTVHVGTDRDSVRWGALIEYRREEFGDAAPRVRARDDLVLVSTGSLFRARSGEEIPGSWSWPWFDGSPLITWGEGGGQVILPGTAQVVDLPGLGVPAMIDDGSRPPVTIVQSDDYISMDAVAEDGEVLWQAESGWPVVRFGDAIIMGDADSGARDVRTGEWLWSIPGFVSCSCRGNPSGLLVSIHDLDPDGGPTNRRLIGLRVTDGAILWELPVTDDALVADTDEALAILVDGQLTLYSRT